MEVRKIAKKTVSVIEPKQSLLVDKAKYQQTRMAAYCRVSTDSAEQKTSYETQKQVYTDMIAKRKDWEMVGIYADEGISGTRADKRPEFNRMIKDCLSGKIDYIITKSVSRFARNTVECLEYVRMLKARNIGILFEEQNIDTLKCDSELYLVIYAGFAQSESESMSKNITWAFRKNFEEGKVVINYKRMITERCQVGISYAIGKAEPIAVSVDSFGTSSFSDEELAEIVTKVFDLRPAAIIDQFDLTKPIFKKTSAYGHFNSPDFPWEKTDAVPELMKVAI